MNNVLEVFKGISKNTISDSLFASKNVERISVFFYTKSLFDNIPYATGAIEFKVNDTEGKKAFKGTNLLDVMNQMQEFLKQLE